MVVYTTYKTDAKGGGKVTAKAMGRQRTVAYDHSRSVNANHGAAAGVLLNALGWTPEYFDSTHKNHTVQPNGRHIFTLTDHAVARVRGL